MGKVRVLKKSTRFGPEELGRGREEVGILGDFSGANPKIFAAVADFAFTND